MASMLDFLDELDEYASFEFTSEHYQRQVFRRGTGPAVIVMHEIPGIHPQFIRFADRVAAAGMTVFLPNLTGQPGRPITKGYRRSEILKLVCIRREFTLWPGGRSSPIVDWLRALARHAHRECGGRGVGAVGMCFTGGFALAMMTDPSMVAPVLSQPSLPVPITRNNRSSIGLSYSETACIRDRFEAEPFSIVGLRFRSDRNVPDERFAAYKEMFGDKFEAFEFHDADAAPSWMLPHSVLTVHLVDERGSPTKHAEQRVIDLLSQRTKFQA